MKKQRLLLATLLVLLVAGCNQPEQAATADPETQQADSLPGMELEGMFRYMADAALFRDCRDNKSYPVSMEGEYIEAERAYRNSGIEPGSEVMVTLRGRLLERPAMEGNTNRVKLIVDKLDKILPDETCTPTTHAMDTERDFLAALSATTRYEISGLFMALYAEDQLLARFEAIYL